MTNPDRRTVLRGAGALGAAALAAPALSSCASDGGATTAGATTPTTVTVPAASVPLGGGVIQDRVVVAQPMEGSFTAFNAVCPHQGCAVDSVADDVITCPCHGSTFRTSDGSKISGPATTGLEPYSAAVDGSDVVVTT